MTHGPEKSDRSVVPKKSPNKAGPEAAEGMEERGRAKGNSGQQTTSQARNWSDVSFALERVREVAVKDKEVKFTSLLHHVYNVPLLRKVFQGLNRNAAPGIDGRTWKDYARNLEANLKDLADRIRRGAYRATPVRRTYLEKPDGRQRPLGVPVLEDKIVQGAAAKVLSAIYETDFLGFSYGFRPERGAHDALTALTVALLRRRVNYVLDADIRGFFDALIHAWLVKFLQHRISDERVVHLIQKWLNAGVLEDGELRQVSEGTPQGGTISPLLANVYLHYVFDLWAQRWRESVKGHVIVVRYADDFIVGFERKEDAEQFLADLRQRLEKFGLELHPEKTRLLEFGRFAAERRRRQGLGKPETFQFLGFTHICGKTRDGKFTVLRHTNRPRMRAKLHKLKEELRQRMHDSVPIVGKWLRAVVRGHFNYFGVPRNLRALSLFRFVLVRLWKRVLDRRSQTGHVRWDRMRRIADHWLPTPELCHDHPWLRPCVTT
jgi:RNA-directed DNA polymerase